MGALEESRQALPSSEEEFGFLSELLQSRQLHALVQVHNKILDNGKDEKFHPVLSSSMQIALEVLDVILPRININEDCKELFLLLQKSHLQVCMILILLGNFVLFLIHNNHIIISWLMLLNIIELEIANHFSVLRNQITVLNSYQSISNNTAYSLLTI